MPKLGPSQDRTVLKDVTIRERAERYVTVKEVAEDLEMTDNGVRWGMKSLGIPSFKFPLDSRTYIKKGDARRIRALRRAART